MSASPPAVAEWRDFSFSEFYVHDNTWRNIRMINHTTGEAEWALHWWCTNQSEVFDMRTDKWQITNQGGESPTAFGKQILSTYLGATRLLGECKAEDCHTMPPEHSPIPANLLPCHNPGQPMDVAEAWMD